MLSFGMMGDVYHREQIREKEEECQSLKAELAEKEKEVKTHLQAIDNLQSVLDMFHQEREVEVQTRSLTLHTLQRHCVGGGRIPDSFCHFCLFTYSEWFYLTSNPASSKKFCR